MMNKRQIALLLLVIMPVYKVSTLPSYLASVAENDMWLSMLVVQGLEIFTLIPILLVATRGGLKNILPKFVYVVIACICVLWWTLRLGMLNTDVVHYVSKILFEHDKRLLIISLLMGGSLYVASRGVRSIGRVAELTIYPFALLVVVFVIFNKGQPDFSEILPICDRGVSSLTAGLNLGVWFGDFLPLMFLDLRGDESSSAKIYISVIVATVLEVLLCIVFIATYKALASSTDSVLSRLMDQVILSSEVGRLDYVGIIVWIMAIILYVSYILAFVKKAVQDFSNYKVAMIVISAISVAIVIINEYVWTAVHQAYATALSLWWVAIVMHYILPIGMMIVALRRKNEYTLKTQV